MERKHGNVAVATLAICLFVSGLMTGCAGPSTRILPRDVVGERPYETPEENQVLEEVNPFYLQESLDYLSGFVRVSGTPGEGEAAEYIRQLLEDYGYETRIQKFSAENFTEGAIVQGNNVIGSRKASSPDSDILIVAANHDSLPGSPGANNNASGVVTLLECARLLSRLPTDTELRFVSFAGSREGAAGGSSYVNSLTEIERHRVIGIIYLDTLGYLSDSQVVLGTMDGNQTLLGDMLKKMSGDISELTSGWQYVLRMEGGHVPFIRGEIPAVVVSQEEEAYENGTPQDRADIVYVDSLASVADIISHTVAGLMSADTPSQLAKSRFMNNLQENVWVQRRDSRFPFGKGHEQADATIGITGTLFSSNMDGTGRQVDTYQYWMKWFDVDQIILTNYHYSDGKLETISLDADGAGVEFEEMKERIRSWYGEPARENAGPNGIAYDWEDPLYHKFIALIPVSGGFEVEIQEFIPEKKELGTFLSDGTGIGQNNGDPRFEKLLDLILDIFPNEDYGSLSRIVVYTDGIGDTTCYLERIKEETEVTGEETGIQQVQLWVDIEDALSEDGEWRNQTNTVRILVKSLGQLLEGDAEGQDGIATDFAEYFMRFVLFQKPVEIRDSSDGRILSFYQDGELVKLRTWIRENLQLEDEIATELLPPESGAMLPKP